MASMLRTDAMAGYCSAVAIIQEEKNPFSLQMSTDCTATVTLLSEGPDPSTTSAERGLRTFLHGGRFWSEFLVQSN